MPSSPNMITSEVQTKYTTKQNFSFKCNIYSHICLGDGKEITTNLQFEKNKFYLKINIFLFDFYFKSLEYNFLNNTQFSNKVQFLHYKSDFFSNSI